MWGAQFTHSLVEECSDHLTAFYKKETVNKYTLVPIPGISAAEMAHSGYISGSDVPKSRRSR